MDRKNIFLIIIFIICIITFFGTIYNSVKSGINLNKVNKVYTDINILNDRISVYYINNGYIPIKGENINFIENSINPNDNDNFYEIDLEKLENLSINFGKKENGIDDIYIINEQSHTIYYLQGVTYNDKKIYSQKLDYDIIDLEKYK